MNSLNSKYSAVKAIFEELPKTLKSISVIGSLCGFFYLFAYTREVGIPFPLELSVLPAALLLIGAVSILGTALVFSGVLAPAILADDPITSSVLLAEDIKDCREQTRLKRYITCSWAPMAIALLGVFFLVGMFDIGAMKIPAAISLVVISFGWIVFMSKRVVTQENKRTEYIVTIIGQTALSVLAYLLTAIIFWALFPEVGKWAAWKGFSLVLAVFTPLHILVTMPNDGSMGKKILLPPHYEFKATPATATAFGVLAFFVALSVFIYPVNAKIGKTVLFSFGVGGEIPVIVCLKDAPPSQVSRRITFGSDNCSEPLAMLFDAGDRLYVAKQLATQKDDVQEKSPATEPIYFRQDQIRQKIYLPNNRQKKEDEGASK